MTKEELIIYAIRTSEAIKEEKKQDLIDYVSNLQQENSKYKEVIDKAIKRLEKGIFIIPKDTNELLDILKEVE